MPSKQAFRHEIGEDLDFQRRNWRAQRVGWTLLGLLIVAGLAGLLGPGPLSNVDVRDGQALRVEYERFVRHGAPSEFRVTIPRPRSRQVRIAVTREYLDALRLLQVLPVPTRVQASGQDLIYTFETVGDGEMKATFAIRPEKIGTHVARIAVEDGSHVPIRQFTYP